jgi:hypothetical protein
MSASTRTAQQPLGIQFGAILAIVALAMVAALAFAVSTSGTLKPAAPAPAAAVGPDHADLPDVGHGTGVAAQPDGTWISNGRGGVEFVPTQPLRRTRNGVPADSNSGTGTRIGGPDDGIAPIIHGPRVDPE